MGILDTAKYKYKGFNVLEKIIAVNVVVFLVFFFLRPFSYWLELPSGFNDYLSKPWTILSYCFLHYSPMHILFNMLWLYFIGRMFLNLFKAKMALNLYFLGAIVGGLFFIAGYTFLPSFFKGKAVLVGASAGVRALVIFICAYMPNRDTQIFSFNLKLAHIGMALVAMDVFGLFGANSGGNLAHLGGAFLGYIYAKQLHKGNDIGKGFEGYMDAVSNWFSKKESKNKNLKTVYKSKTKVGGYSAGEFKQFNNQKQVDLILDKISKSGYESLTATEKEFLFKAGK